MSTLTTKNEVAGKSCPPEDAEKPAACGTSVCSSGVCSPCVIIWGLVALYFVVTAFLEYFR